MLAGAANGKNSMTKIEIRNHLNDSVIFVHVAEENSVKLTVTAACANGADLSGAKLSGADLNGADLSGAKLSGAILLRAILSGANLSSIVDPRFETVV